MVYSVVGCALEALNTLGHGLHEKPYENALVVESGLRRIPYEHQRRFGLFYKAVAVGEYVPDLIAGSAVVVDAKVIDPISDFERGQRLNYLRITKLRAGPVINFRKPKLEWERIAL